MSASKKQAIENAEAIIEAFGGLRPMAAKIDVAVTTIQGWKKRGVIPGARKEAILKAAEEHKIDVSEFFDDAKKESAASAASDPVESKEAVSSKSIDRKEVSEDKNTAAEKSEAKKDHTPKEDSKADDSAAQDKKESVAATTSKEIKREEKSSEPIEIPKALIPEKSPKVLDEEQAREEDHRFTQLVIETEKRAVTKSALIASSMIVVVLIAIIVMLWPDYEEFDSREVRLANLENNVGEIKNQQSMFKGLVPENWNEQLESLRQQVDGAGKKVTQAVEDVKGMSQDLANGNLMNAGADIQNRVAQLQGYVSEVTNNESVTSLVQRFDSMRQNVMGQETLNDAVTQLSALLVANEGNTAHQTETGTSSVDADAGFNAMLASAKGQSQALGKTFENVPQSELKAAAMLFAMTQVRSALNRKEEAFDNDLDLLMGMVGEDNVELRSALAKLAPHSKSGVLSAGGLKSEFQTIAGEVVAASLSGEDVSVGDKFSAKMNEILKIEKNGELVSGTETQAKIAKAENMVMEDRFDEAMTFLKSHLHAKELEPLRPWFQKVEGVLASAKVQDAIKKAINISSGEGLLGGADLLQQ